MQLQPIQIPRGILQGDCLLPLLFCIALTPLTNELTELIVDIKYTELRENKSLIVYEWPETART